MSLLLMLQVLQLTTRDMRAQQAYHYTPLRTNFFTLLRFDFMLDERGDTYLLEVGGTVQGCWRQLNGPAGLCVWPACGQRVAFGCSIGAGQLQ
jgi:hypothetical protein